MLPLGALFAFIGRQVGRVLSLAFAWATTALFGRVPESKQFLLSAMAGAALAWPIVLAGVAWQDRDLVFTTPTGAPIDGRALIRTWFRPLLKKADLPPIRIHDLRHSYASIALARGVHPKVVQEAMGHSTIAVTLDLYSHVVPSLQREAAKEMGAALFG